MPNVRDTIRSRAEELGLTAHKLSQMVGDAISRRSLYRYMNEDDQDLSGEKIGKLLAVLGLEIRQKKVSKKS